MKSILLHSILRSARSMSRWPALPVKTCSCCSGTSKERSTDVTEIHITRGYSLGSRMKMIQHTTSQAEAEKAIRKSLRRRFFLRPGNLQRLELLHVPFHTFRCVVVAPEKEFPLIAAVDALIGDLASTIDENTSTAEGAGQSVPEPILSQDAVRQTAFEHVRWLVIQGRMFGATKGGLKNCAFEGTVAYPYWVGYIRRGKRYDLRVVDAISGDLTGPKVKRVVLAAIRALSNGER